MSRFSLIFAAVSFCMTFTLGSSARPGDSKTGDAVTLQGNWVPLSAELGGAPMPDAILKMISLKLEDGKYEVFVGESPDRGTYSIDVSTNPKSMTVTGTEGPNVGKTFPAIYEIGKNENGDTVRICYDLSGEKRPTEFKTVAGTKLYLVTYGRKMP